MKIFLTGGTGFIGKAFLKLAVKYGHTIYAVSRKKQNKKKNVIWLKGNIDKDWSHYLKRSDILIHMAADGVNKNISLKQAINNNVIKPYKLLVNAIYSNCNKWLIVGSAAEYGRQAEKKKPLSRNTKELPETNYEISKYYFTRLGISLSNSLNAHCKVMRLFNVYGNGENKKRLWPSLKRAIKLNKNLFMTSGTQIRDFIHVNRVAEILLNAAISKKKFFSGIWHVASGKPVSVKLFALKEWKKSGTKKQIFFNKIKTHLNRNYISDKKSIWSAR